MPAYNIPLLPGCSYHIFTRAIGNEKLFLNEENYKFFLGKFKSHILPVADVFAYNLLPNHFHFLIRIKPIEQIKSKFLEVKKNKPFDIEKVPEFIMERFGNLLNSYTKSFNKINKRKGGLFMDVLRRVEIFDDSQFATEIFYVHKNAVHHQYVTSIVEWRWSSYRSLLSESPTMLLRKEVIDFFGGKEAFTKFHQQPIFAKNNSMEE
jgi:REP element-mobilizing transposase RayT